MSTHVIERSVRTRAALPAQALQQLRWLAAGLGLAFLVPFVLADRLALPRDLFYGLYAASVVAFFVLWARSTGQPLSAMVRRRWRLTLVLGAAFAAILAVSVLRIDEATARPDGLELAAAVIWRGVVYGATDGLFLSAFPILAVFAAFAGTRLRARLRGTLAVGAAALAASMVMTAVYHAGYGDFRSGKLAKPVAGDVVWSIPTLVTLNPLGAPIAHAGMHVTAVLHSYETDLYLPPHE